MTKLNDYNITLHLRCEHNPRKWIVDHFYDNLNTKFGEDILYWDVKDIKETKPNPPKDKEETNDKETK